MTVTCDKRSPVVVRARPRANGWAARAWTVMPALAVVGVLGIVVARTWVCDDAFITLRTIDNWVHGFGPRWNIADRVQTYTHPLWMLLVAVPYALTREPYFSVVVLSWALTALAVAVLVLRLAHTPAAGAVAALLLGSSVAFTDFSTSGLENPLVHALLACFLATDSIVVATTLASAIALARPDAILLVAPAVLQLYAACRDPRQRRLALAVGLSPLLLWAALSISYYGFVWPNTAYAKLGTGIPALELGRQGVRYLAESLAHDPLTLCAIAAASVVIALRGDRFERACSLGIALNLAWVVRIGGDFMSGRFLTCAFFLATALWARRGIGTRAALGVVAACLLVSSFTTRASWRLGSAESAELIDAAGIADERGFYLGATGLAARLRSGPEIEHRARLEGSQLRDRGRMVIRLTTLGSGLFGYYAGPDVHIVDVWALNDPLLARLPALRQLHWRVGHFARAVPAGYIKTLSSGHNQLRDPALARYWDELALVVRGPVFSLARWRAIAAFALGRVGGELDREHYQLADMVHGSCAQDGAAIRFGDGGLELRFAPELRATRVALELTGGSRYALRWYAESGVSADSVSESTSAPLPVPAAVRERLARLRILPLQGAGSYSLSRCGAASADR